MVANWELLTTDCNHRRCFSGFGCEVDQDVAGLSADQCSLLCDHRNDDCAQSAIVGIALDHNRRPQFGTRSFAEREINHHRDRLALASFPLRQLLLPMPFGHGPVLIIQDIASQP